MFGFLRKKPLRLVPFAEAPPRGFTPLLCDGVSAHHLPSFAALLELHARLQAEQPDRRVLATLDDLGQAFYTSGHGVDVHELDDTAGHDLSALPAAAFEDGRHLGWFSTPAEFPLRLANLKARAREVEFDQVVGLLDWETTGDANDLVTVNGDPDAALRLDREKEVLFQFVPVTAAADLIAAFPNGYFAADLNPMQNHALARRLETAHGLELFGIGSRFLAFRRAAPLDGETARAVAGELAAFYAGTPPGRAEALARLLTGRDWLLLRYTES